ncbi:MAG: hypothetical protein WAT27_12945, partial [Chitinophagales bacterium]
AAGFSAPTPRSQKKLAVGFPLQPLTQTPLHKCNHFYEQNSNMLKQYAPKKTIIRRKNAVNNDYI